MMDMSANTPRIEPVRLADYRPTLYAIRTVALDFRLDPEATEVTADLRLERRDGTAPGTPLVLDGEELTHDELMAAEGHYFRLYEAQARRTESEADGESEHDQVLLSHQLPQPSAHGTASH